MNIVFFGTPKFASEILKEISVNKTEKNTTKTAQATGEQFKIDLQFPLADTGIQVGRLVPVAPVGGAPGRAVGLSHRRYLSRALGFCLQQRTDCEAQAAGAAQLG